MRDPKISAVCCTFKRFTCVERVINCFLAQDYPNKELIVYNTDVDSPYADSNIPDVYFVNCNTDYETREPYTNVGAIRRDALRFAKGKYVVTWDDDDIFLPWFMRQAIDRMKETGLPSFKPEFSFFYSGNNLRLVCNTLEASVVADIEKVREYGYLLETGKEGLGWYTKMRDNRELNEHDIYYLPSYCFNWNDGQEMKAPHKQSGDINNPDNFENHKKQSLDGVDGRLIEAWDQDKLKELYHPYYQYLIKNSLEFPSDLLERHMS